MNSHDDDGSDHEEWPPKRSGRRKIGEAQSPEPLFGADEPGPESDRPELLEGIELGTAMRRALDDDEAPARVDVLRGVQERLRERSGGKFYGDGWSTLRHPPIATFFITSLLMLAVIALAYAILVPLSGDPVELPSEPSPINVLPP